MQPPHERAATLWITGLSGAGKSTIARALEARLHQLGRRAERLDGDEIRATLSAGLGFSRADRDANILRIGWVAHLLTRNGVFAIVAAISPYQRARDQNRALIGDFFEVYASAPLSVCEARDPKGLYQKARRGEIACFTGVSDPYEPPPAPELVCDTDRQTADACAEDILQTLRARGYLAPAP